MEVLGKTSSTEAEFEWAIKRASYFVSPIPFIARRIDENVLFRKQSHKDMRRVYSKSISCMKEYYFEHKLESRLLISLFLLYL